MKDKEGLSDHSHYLLIIFLLLFENKGELKGQEGRERNDITLRLSVGGKENIPGMYLQHRGTYLT